jgi:hypothetical protein
MTTFVCSGCGKKVESSGFTGLPHERCPKSGRWAESTESTYLPEVTQTPESSEIPTNENVRQQFAQIQDDFGKLHRRLIYAYKAADKLDKHDQPTLEDRTKAMQAAEEFTNALIKSKIAIPNAPTSQMTQV